MAGLSNFISNQATQQTTMPSWYDQAQQNVVNMATTGAQNVPTLGQTVAGGAIQQLQGPQNPFTQAQSTLNQIATGAANPWITSPTGQVTPNVATPLGGLFQAQNQALQQLMPQYTAPVEAGAIGTGQFGSLRGKTAVDKAMADAQAKLFADQMQAALQSQQIGTQAATGLGGVGSQGVTAMTNLGQAQQADPLLAASALGKILGGMQVGTTQKNITNLSPLNQIGSIASALGGSASGANKLLQDLGVKGGLSELFRSLTGRNVGAGLSAGTYDLADGGKMVIDAGGNKMITMPDGSYQTFDKDGNLVNSGNAPTGGNTDEDYGGGSIDTGGGGTDINWDADIGGGGGVDWTGGGGVIDTGTGEDWNMG